VGGESQTDDFFLAVLLILPVTWIFLHAVCFNVSLTSPFEGLMKQQCLLKLPIFETLAPMRWTLSVFDNVFDIHCPT